MDDVIIPLIVGLFIGAQIYRAYQVMQSRTYEIHTGKDQRNVYHGEAAYKMGLSQVVGLSALLIAVFMLFLGDTTLFNVIGIVMSIGGLLIIGAGILNLRHHQPQVVDDSQN